MSRLVYNQLIISGPNLMANEQQTLQLFEELEGFLQSKIENCKCILIVGARNSGKTCLIKYFGGVAFTRDTNEEDLPFLVENTEIPPDTQPQFFNNPKLAIELAILRVNDPNTGEEVTIIEMPSFSSVSPQAESVNDARSLLNNVVFNIHIWNTVLSLAKQIHICLINPYEFIIDDHKLVQFFGIWQQIVTKNEEAKQDIKQSVSIIFTKPEYEDDKQSLITGLSHLSQAGNQSIPQDNTFFNAVEQNRVFCFLGQDTEQGQGQELLNSIMGAAAYYSTEEESLLSRQWSEIFIWHFVKDLQDETLKQIFHLLELLYKKFFETQRHCQIFFDKSLRSLGIAATLGFIKSLPKQSKLKQKDKDLQAQLKSITKYQSPALISVLLKIQQNSQKSDKYFQLLNNINNLIVKTLKAPVLLEEFFRESLSACQQIFKLEDRNQRILSNCMLDKASLWKLTSSFWNVCHNHKENHQLQVGAHLMQDLSKSAIKKFVSLLKTKIVSGLKSYQILTHIAAQKKLAQTPSFKQLSLAFGSEEEGGEDPLVQQQDSSAPSDSRIKRWYYKGEENRDMYAEIKEKAKKLVIKSNLKSDQLNERENIKNLLSSIEREQDALNQNLELLAKKFIEFRFFQSALEVYMDLGDSLKLYKFLTQFYFPYLEDDQKESSFQYMQNTLIPYLDEKTALYSDTSSANYFLFSAQCCYDYLTAKFAESSEEYTQMLAISNQLEMPNEEKILDFNELAKIEKGRRPRNSELQLLSFSSFSKAEAIEKIYERDQKCKKNGVLLSQIRKYMEAAQTQVKAK